MKTYNLVQGAIVNHAGQKTPESARRLASAISAVLLTTVVNNVVTALVDSWRDDEDGSFLEKWQSHFKDNMLGELWGWIPFGRDIASAVQGFTVKRMDVQGVSDLAVAIGKLPDEKFTPFYKLQNIAQKGGDILGVPASSFVREVAAAARNAIQITGSHWAQHIINKSLYAMDYPSNKKVFMDTLFAAYQEENRDEYRKIRLDLLNHGFDAEALDDALRQRQLSGIEKTDEFQSKVPVETAGILGPLTDSTGYQRLASGEQEKARDMAADYAKYHFIDRAMELMGEDYDIPTNKSWITKADSVAGAGVSVSEYILYQVAMGMAQEDGSLKQAEVIEELKRMTWLSNGERAALFAVRYPGSKNNPFE